MTTPRAERRLAAILAADAVGYSRMMGADESGTHAALKALRQQLVDPAVARRGGRVFKTTGDGFLAEFPSVVEATLAAIEIQRGAESQSAALPPGRQLHLRMGINIGDVIVDDGDIYGDGVNIAARLESIAEPGGICLSGAAYQHVTGKVDAKVIARGPTTLKNIAAKIEVFAIDLGGPKPKAPLGQWMARERRSATLLAAALAALAGAAVVGWLYVASLSPPAPPLPSNSGTAIVLPTLTKPIIAVLPLANLSGDANQDYFSDGLTEDLIGALGRFNSLAVLTRSAVERFRRNEASPAEIGKSVGARFVVQGSVRRAGERLRVSVQLSDTKSGLVMWSQQFDAELKDVFAVQAEIVRQIAGRLAVQVREIEVAQAAQKPTENLEAYDYFLRGRQLLVHSIRSANIEARGYLLKAVAIDPNFAAAQAALADSYYRLALLGWSSDPQASFNQAGAIARKALALDPRSVHALVVLSKINGVQLNQEQALALAQDAIKLNPSDAQAYFGMGAALTWIGRIDGAVAAMEAALAFGYTFDDSERFVCGVAYFLARRYDKAIAILIDPVQGPPRQPYAQALLAAIYIEAGEPAKARAAFAEVRKLAPFFDIERFGTALRDPALATRLREATRKASALN